MDIEALFGTSDSMAAELGEYVAKVPLADSHPRRLASESACHVAWQHWSAARGLLRAELFTSAAVLHRSQYEAIVRAIWILFCASDVQIQSLWSPGPETEQTARDLPMASEMLIGLKARAPKEAYVPLLEFRDVSWKALNSFVHTGRHAIRRNNLGYPQGAVTGLLQNCNGLGVFACMTTVIVVGSAHLQRDIIEIGDRFPECLPKRRDA